MKKLLSLGLALLMIFAVVAGVIPANAAGAANTEDVEAKYFDVEPVIDGYISEAEWGEATVFVQENPSDPNQKPTTIGGTTPYPNRFFYNEASYAVDSLDMEYYLWLRWDENYFYIGAKITDPDGHSLKNGRTNTWNGDALQVRIDPDGSNAICYGGDFNPGAYPNTYAADGTTVVEYGHRPWSSKSVCDLIFGYVQGAGGYKEAWNNTTNHNKSMILNSAYTQSNGFVDLAIAPAGMSYSSDSSSGVTTYEVAIPWKYIDYNRTNGHEYYKNATLKKTNPDGSIKQGPDGAIGYEYGMSAVVYNADGAAGGNKLNAALGWGSGIITRQLWDDSYATCAGSNAVILSGDKVSEDELYSAGYTTYTTGGPITQLPPPDYDFEKDPAVHKKLTYDDAADMEIFGDVSNGERVQLEDGNWVVKWDLATERDEPNAETGELPTHNTANYLSTDGYEENGADARYESVGNSFTFEFDIKVTGLEAFETGYGSMIYNWFGGTSSVDYQCGYFFDESKFKIVNTNDPSEVVAECSYTLEKDVWYHWVFQYDNATCTARFYLNPEMDGDKVASTATPMFNLMYRYFDYGSIEKTILILRRMNAQIQLDNVELYNFVDFTGTNDRSDEKLPDNSTQAPTDTKQDIEIETGIVQREDGTFALTVTNNEKYKANNLKALSFTVTYDAEKVVFKGVEDLDESKYTITDDGNGKAVITIKDLSVFKGADVSADMLKVIVAPKDGVTLTVDDIKALVNVKANITTTSAATGDAVVWVSAALLVVLALSTGIVIYRRKRNTVEF